MYSEHEIEKFLKAGRLYCVTSFTCGCTCITPVPLTEDEVDLIGKCSRCRNTDNRVVDTANYIGATDERQVVDTHVENYSVR